MICSNNWFPQLLEAGLFALLIPLLHRPQAFLEGSNRLDHFSEFLKFQWAVWKFKRKESFKFNCWKYKRVLLIVQNIWKTAFILHFYLMWSLPFAVRSNVTCLSTMDAPFATALWGCGQSSSFCTGLFIRLFLELTVYSPQSWDVTLFVSLNLEKRGYCGSGTQ